MAAMTLVWHKERGERPTQEYLDSVLGRQLSFGRQDSPADG
jgi:hypothetical protein